VCYARNSTSTKSNNCELQTWTLILSCIRVKIVRQNFKMSRYVHFICVLFDNFSENKFDLSRLIVPTANLISKSDQIVLCPPIPMSLAYAIDGPFFSGMANWRGKCNCTFTSISARPRNVKS
jgi:hypothetical protein